MEEADTPHNGDEFMLGVSAKQYGHREIFQYSRSREVTGENSNKLVNTNNTVNTVFTTILFHTLQVIKYAEALLLATQERSHYKGAIDSAKEVLKNTFTVEGQLLVPPINACLPSNSNDITMHFSFDMGQQVL